MLLKDTKALKVSDKTPTLAQVNRRLVGTAAGVPHSRHQCPAKNATCHYCLKVGHLARVYLSKLKKKDVHGIEAASNGASESVPEPSDHMFLGPISATPLTSSVHAISCKEKALLEVSLALSPEGKQTRVLRKIDSGVETSIIPTSLYNQPGPRVMNLQKPTMKLTAHAGTEFPNLGSCHNWQHISAKFESSETQLVRRL